MRSVSVILAAIVLLHAPIAAQDRPKNDDRALKELARQETESPTTAENVRERHSSLVHAVLQSGRTEEILPREDAFALSDLIQSGKLDDAAWRVHAIILSLEPARPEASVELHRLLVGERFQNVLKLHNPCIDSERRRLYVGGVLSTCIASIDLDRDELVETFDVGFPIGYLVVDPKTGDLYSYDIGWPDQIRRIDPRAKKADPQPVAKGQAPVAPPSRREPKAYKDWTFANTGYPFKPGWLPDANASYGVIVVKDRDQKEVKRIPYGPDALYFDIDPKTGRLYTTNTGDGSLTVLDLERGFAKVKEIDVGTSADEVVAIPGGRGFFVRNRLGGSQLYRYDLKTKGLAKVLNENQAEGGIGLWPTQMILDGGRLYVLAHYMGRVDVLDAESLEVVVRIDLELPQRPRTDGISAMTMDRKRKLLYAAIPELGCIAVADAAAGRAVRVVDLKEHGYDASIIGPNRILLGVDEETGRLFVTLTEEKTLLAFDAGGARLLKKVSDERIERKRTGGAGLVAHPGKGVLYSGSTILDAATLEPKGTFARGNRVVGIDVARDRVYLAEAGRAAGPGAMNETLYEYEKGQLRRTWKLQSVRSIPSSFSFDFEARRIFYVARFEAAVVDVYSLE